MTENFSQYQKFGILGYCSYKNHIYVRELVCSRGNRLDSDVLLILNYLHGIDRSCKDDFFRAKKKPDSAGLKILFDASIIVLFRSDCFLGQFLVEGIAVGIDLTFFYSRFNGASRFIQMTAVRKAAILHTVSNLRHTAHDVV